MIGDPIVVNDEEDASSFDTLANALMASVTAFADHPVPKNRVTLKRELEAFLTYAHPGGGRNTYGDLTRLPSYINDGSESGLRALFVSLYDRLISLAYQGQNNSYENIIHNPRPLWTLFAKIEAAMAREIVPAALGYDPYAR